jgi:hypothetical protein
MSEAFKRNVARLSAPYIAVFERHGIPEPRFGRVSSGSLENLAVTFEQKGNKKLITELQALGWRLLRKRSATGFMGQYHDPHKYSGYTMVVEMESPAVNIGGDAE